MITSPLAHNLRNVAHSCHCVKGAANELRCPKTKFHPVYKGCCRKTTERNTRCAGGPDWTLSNCFAGNAASFSVKYEMRVFLPKPIGLKTVGCINLSKNRQACSPNLTSDKFGQASAFVRYVYATSLCESVLCRPRSVSHLTASCSWPFNYQSSPARRARERCRRGPSLAIFKVMPNLRHRAVRVPACGCRRRPARRVRDTQAPACRGLREL